jgi:hypothetical protein
MGLSFRRESPERFAVRGSGAIRFENLVHDRLNLGSMSTFLLGKRRRPDLRHAPGHHEGHGAAQHDFPRTMEGGLRSTHSRLFHYAGSHDESCGGGRKPPTLRQPDYVCADRMYDVQALDIALAMQKRGILTPQYARLKN